MKYKLIILTALISTSAFASDPMPEDIPPSEMIKSVMEEAEQTYKSSSATPRPQLPSVLSDKHVSNFETKKYSTMEELAEQVDSLKNRVIVERSNLLATQTPKKVKVVGGKTTFNYLDGAIYEVTASVDHVTDITLKAGENLTTPPTSGDTVRWHLNVMKSGTGAKSQVHLIVKPLDENIETYLIIATDQNVYHIKLKSSDFHMPSVAWNYPSDEVALMEKAMIKDQSEEATISPEKLRFDYEIDGDDYDWKPVRVFDDGFKTYIQMPKSYRVTEAPVLFLLEESETPLIVNYRVKGDLYIVDRLIEKAELRVGPEKSITITPDDGFNFFTRLFN